jgi:hypothetical protein
MKRLLLTVMVASAAALTACGRTEVIVQGQIETAEGQQAALRDLPIRILPYDRDAIFDSLRAEYPEPEPEIPADMAAMQDSIARAQAEWRTAESRWNAGRDSLRELRAQMDRLGRGSGQYVAMFNQFSALEPQVNAAQRQSEQAFARFQELNTRFASRAQELRLARDAWSDAAYNDVDRVIAARLKELRREPRADTLDANGVKRVRGLRAGQWWVTAHYDLPFEELYWNVPITVDRSEPVQVQLTRATAQVRPKL